MGGVDEEVAQFEDRSVVITPEENKRSVHSLPLHPARPDFGTSSTGARSALSFSSRLTHPSFLL